MKAMALINTLLDFQDFKCTATKYYLLNWFDSVRLIMRTNAHIIMVVAFGITTATHATPFEPFIIDDLGSELVEQRTTSQTDRVTCYHKRVPCFTYGVPRINE